MSPTSLSPFLYGAEVNIPIELGVEVNVGAEVHRMVPKFFRAEVTRAEHRYPHDIHIIK